MKQLAAFACVFAWLSCQSESPPAESAGAKKPSAQPSPQNGDAKPNAPQNPGASDGGEPLGGSSDPEDGNNPSDDGGGGKGGNDPSSGGIEKRAITFKGSRGDNVPGYVWIPKNKKAGAKYPAALLMYGIKGDKDDGSIATAAQILGEAGIIGMTLDWPGTGARGHIGNQDRIMKVDVLNWTVGDYGTALDYLTSLPEVDGSRIGYVGASMGAMTGLSLAAKDSRIKAIAAIVPIPNPLWGGEDPSSTIGRVSPRPVLCVHAADNSDLSAGVCNNTAAGGEKKALPGGHELEGFRDQVVTVTKAFLVKHLRP